MLIAISPAGQLFTCQERDRQWVVCKRQPDGVWRRHLSLDLPLRFNQTEAEQDMRKWAEKRGYEIKVIEGRLSLERTGKKAA